jgi:hypothetical protein
MESNGIHLKNNLNLLNKIKWPHIIFNLMMILPKFNNYVGLKNDEFIVYVFIYFKS